MSGRFQTSNITGVKEMSVNEKTEFLVWYEKQKSVVFNNRQMLEY
jgi:hypothetical protein